MRQANNLKISISRRIPFTGIYNHPTQNVGQRHKQRCRYDSVLDERLIGSEITVVEND